MARGTRPVRVAMLFVALLLAACSGAQRATDGGAVHAPTDAAPAGARATASPPGDVTGTVTVYTSVTQDTVDAVTAAYRQSYPAVEVEVFRAPTGELNARIAAERREGGIAADVLWLTDPLSMQQFAADGELREWTPSNADAVPAEYRQDAFWGTRLLNLVIVHQPGLEPAPASWRDLAGADYDQPVAIPDPGFAGSAFGALGYLALAEGYGFDFYRALADAGAVQVQAPGEVVTGVAEGRFAAGMTLDREARDAIADGSPVEMLAPDPGAIAIYSPIAILAGATEPGAAESFADFTLGTEAQQAIADTGWQPVREDVPWPHDLPVVSPDWPEILALQNELLEEYRTIFGG